MQETEWQTKGQTDRWIDKQSEMPTERQANIPVSRHTGGRTRKYRQTEIYSYRVTDPNKDGDRQTYG